jgi:predicted component of type VI protein secretion system
MGSGKRDFSEFNAKLEKHIERLPDYAQRAQEKLQKYLPPTEGGGARPAPPHRTATSRPPSGQLRMPKMPLGMSPADIPVVAEARSKWAKWNDPAAKLERRKRRTSRALTLWIVLAILSALYFTAAITGLIGAGDLSQMAEGIAGVVVFGALGVKSGVRLVGLKRTVLPVSAPRPAPLPPAGSAAREPMERLAEGEATLAELLRQLSSPSSLGTTAVPEVSVADARATAAEAAQALRGLVERLQAVERARNATPAADRGSLDSAVETLREQLNDGLTGYSGLIAAAGHAVAASSGGLQASKQALTDATDHLAGLAMALRELS